MNAPIDEQVDVRRQLAGLMSAVREAAALPLTDELRSQLNVAGIREIVVTFKVDEREAETAWPVEF